VNDQIEYTLSGRYANVDRTRTDGLEATADVRLSDELTLEGEYAYTDARDLDAGTEMLRVPRNSGSVSLDWRRGPWRASLGARSEGPDADEDPSTFLPATRPGFTLVRVSGSYDLSKQTALTARVEDLADTHYEEVLGYGEPRRMILVGIRMKG